ncbi:MAG: peroxide stress protein YaaA [Lachnospiraceae bacterium]
MIAIISPAKNMKPKKVAYPLTIPVYLEQTKEIVSVLRKYSPWDLQELMKINESLAQDSADRNITIQFDANGYPALETYNGIQYKYMNPESFSKEERIFAQKHIRILSGAYGILKPYDSIYEYRLEMLTKLKVGNFKNLYDYWNRLLYDNISSETNYIINLASTEYSKCIKKYISPRDHFITCTFKVYNKGKYKVLATAAKMARGQMIRYIVENKIDTPELLKNFDVDGYMFQENLSSETEYVFYQR